MLRVRWRSFALFFDKRKNERKKLHALSTRKFDTCIDTVRYQTRD